MKSHRILLLLGICGLLLLSGCKSYEKCPTYGGLNASTPAKTS